MMDSRLIKALNEIRALPNITIGQIVEHVKEESILIVCLVAILPFLQPIPIPGLSSVLGLIVLLQGIGLMVSSKPILTKKLKAVNITHDKFEILYKAAVRFTKFTSKLSAYKHPYTQSKFSHVICGFAIIISAAFLSLPLPIPFSNLIPSLSIFLICVGLLEEDFILIIFGQGITLTVIWMAIFSFHLIQEQIHTWMN